MPDEQSRKYLFVDIDRATRWVYMEIRASKSAGSARAFLKNLIKKAPFVITKTLTDNGKEFTDRFCATGERKSTGNCAWLVLLH
jgi:IS30 family transposase